MRTRKGRRLSRVLQVHLSGIIASADDFFVTPVVAATATQSLLQVWQDEGGSTSA